MNVVPPRPAGSVTDRVPTDQKVAYALGSWHDMWGHWLYPNLAFQVFNIFLGVAPWMVGVALFFNRLFDVVSDPVAGWWSDNARTRWGRRRPFILVAGVLSGVLLPLLVAVGPHWGSSTWFGHEIPHYLWFMLGSSAIYLPVMSAFKVPYDCLGAEMTPDYDERTSVWAYRSAIQKCAELALFFAAQFMTMTAWVGATASDLPARLESLLTSAAAWAPAPAGSEPNILLGAQVYCSVLGALMVVGATLMAWRIRERYYGNVVARGQERISFQETLWQTLRCRPFRLQLAMKLPYGLGTSMVSALGYYTTVYYVCRGDLAAGAVWNFRMGLAGAVFGLLGIPIFALLARWLGKRRALMCAFGSTIAVFAGTWWLYDPAHPWLQVFASGFIAFSNAGFFILDGSMRADVLDYDELDTGKRREGAFIACDSWITKSALAIGAGASGVLLSLVGFSAVRGGQQAEGTLSTLRLLLAAIPIAGTAVALLVVHRFPLTPRRMAEIRAELELRRGVV